MSEKNYRLVFFLLGLDFFLLNISYFSVFYMKRGTLNIYPDYYLKFLVAFNFIWLTASLLMKKFHSASYIKGFRDTIMILVNSAAVSSYIVSFMVVLMGLFTYSRLLIFGTISLIFLAEIGVFTLYYMAYGRKSKVPVGGKKAGTYQKQRISSRLLIADFLLINLSFFILNYLKTGTFWPKPGYEMLLLILYGLWLITALTTRKFDKDNDHGFINAFITCLKSVMLIAVIMALLVFSLRLQYYSRTQIFGTLIIFFLFEILLYGFYAVNKKEQRSEKDVESIDQVKSYLEKELIHSSIVIEDSCSIPEDPVQKKLKAALDFFNPWLFRFIQKSMDLSKICKSKTCILNSDDIVSLQMLNGNALTLILNIHRLNHFRRINQYFLEIYSKLEPGGYFVGKVNTIRTYKEKVKEKYPTYASTVLYTMHFLFFRIAPKLPITRQIYFAGTQGRNRILSRAEVLGRLYFCGFEVVAEQELDYELFFVARKTKRPSAVTNPSYGPIVKLNRFGMNGKPITVYKFRTMYSYSEFLQEYVHNLNKLQEGGKFNNDFRITAWGKLMRKLWLDELPMLYNWIRGDLQLFGVRPLSFQYLSLYCNDLQKIRSRLKPGLIPPFYADLPKTFDKICESEEKYIWAYLERPLKTQLIYFGKAIYNIVIKGARSN